MEIVNSQTLTPNAEIASKIFTLSGGAVLQLTELLMNNIPIRHTHVTLAALNVLQANLQELNIKTLQETLSANVINSIETEQL